MEALDRIKIETEKLLQMRLEQAGGDKNDIDVYFATCLDKALPEVFKILDQNDLLSNMTAVSFLRAYIDRLLQHKPLTPLHSIEQDIDEWFDPLNPTAGPKHLDQYSPTSIEDGDITFCNIRDAAVYYHPGKKKYYDLDQCTLFREISSGVQFTTSSFIDKGTLEYYESFIRLLGYDKFPDTIEITEWPYMPPAERPTVDISWEDDAIRDAMDDSFGYDKEGQTDCGTYQSVCGHLIYFKKYERLLFCLIFMKQDGYFTVPYLIPYTYDGLELDIGTKLKDIAKHNTVWMNQVLNAHGGVYQIIPQGELNCVEREDRKTEGYGFICPMPDIECGIINAPQIISLNAEQKTSNPYYCAAHYDHTLVTDIPLRDIIQKTEQILERHYIGCKQRAAEIEARCDYGCRVLDSNEEHAAKFEIKESE